MPSQPTPIFATVRDAAGQPVPNARALFTRGPGALPDIAALTDANGGFSLTAPIPGAYTIEIAADGFKAESVDVQADGQPKHLEIRLRRAN
jgi:hypothetical protein